MPQALMVVQSTKPTYNHCKEMKMSNLQNFKTATAIVLATAFAAGVATSATADTTWQKNHPRREQVNNRLAGQNARIHDQVKEGELTKAQAARLHKDDHQIRKEERAMASQNGGHITKLEQKTLNQQENRVSNKIGE
jgi:Spy/CpxP family protein refolding chaperone